MYTPEQERARLRWLCRRGMKELDVVLEGFLRDQYEGADAVRQAAFRRVLEMEDPDLYAILMGRQQAADTECQRVIETLRQQMTLAGMSR